MPGGAPRRDAEPCCDQHGRGRRAPRGAYLCCRLLAGNLHVRFRTAEGRRCGARSDRPETVKKKKVVKRAKTATVQRVAVALRALERLARAEPFLFRGRERAGGVRAGFGQSCGFPGIARKQVAVGKRASSLSNSFVSRAISLSAFCTRLRSGAVSTRFSAAALRACARSFVAADLSLPSASAFAQDEADVVVEIAVERCDACRPPPTTGGRRKLPADSGRARRGSPRRGNR